MLKLHLPAMRRVSLGVETGDWKTDVREDDGWLPNSLDTLSSGCGRRKEHVFASMLYSKAEWTVARNARSAYNTGLSGHSLQTCVRMQEMNGSFKTAHTVFTGGAL